MTLKSDNMTWTRRTFVSTLCLAGAADAVPRLHALTAPSPKQRTDRGLAFVAVSKPGEPGTGRIDVFDLGHWMPDSLPVHATPLASPGALVLHPILPILYVAHATSLHHDLPRGSVSAHAFEATGVLRQISHEPLSLSATTPGHLAISPDGRTLLVSSADGGAYNVFNLDSSGSIQPGPYPLKQIGSGPHPGQASARPHSALFNSNGTDAYATDQGADRLNHISFADGIPSIVSRVSFVPGTDPAHLALHPSGRFLVVAGSLQPVLTVVPIDQQSGQILTPSHHQLVDASELGPIAFSPSGDRLSVVTTNHSSLETLIASFRLSLATGRLRRLPYAEIAQVGLPRHFHKAGGSLHLAGSSGIHTLGRGSDVQRMTVGAETTTEITSLVLHQV